MPAGPVIVTSWSGLLGDRALEESAASVASSSLAADERRIQLPRPALCAGDDLEQPPGGDALRAPLERQRADLLGDDRRAARGGGWRRQ